MTSANTQIPDHTLHRHTEEGIRSMIYRINVTWDDEAQVWIAVSEDLEGLVLECGSLDALIERVRIAVPELLEIQGDPLKDITLDFSMERQTAVA